MDKIALSDYQRSIIKRKRKEVGIRTDELSKEMGKAGNYISQIERGKIKKVQIDTLETIMQKINCTYDDLETENTENVDEDDIYTEFDMLRKENEMLKEKLRLIKGIVNI